MCQAVVLPQNREKLRLTISAVSIATLPPESDLDDEQNRALLASPLFLQEREASADLSQVYHHSVREKKGVKFTSSSEEYRETSRVVFKQKEIE